MVVREKGGSKVAAKKSAPISEFSSEKGSYSLLTPSGGRYCVEGLGCKAPGLHEEKIGFRVQGLELQV